MDPILTTLNNQPKPTKDEFRCLATKHPDQLVLWIKSGTLQPTALTFAAEALGTAEDSTLVVDCLLSLLEHPSSVVREGAIYGLTDHLDYPGVRTRLQAVVQDDPQQGVRRAASEALE